MEVDTGRERERSVKMQSVLHVERRSSPMVADWLTWHGLMLPVRPVFFFCCMLLQSEIANTS